MKMRTALIAFLASLLLQVSLVPFAGSEMIRPNLPLLVLVVFATRRGAFQAVLFGFVAGLLLDVLSSGMFGMSAFVFSLTGFVTGKLFHSDLPLPLGLWAFASAIGLLLAALAWSVLITFGTLAPVGGTLSAQMIPSAAYTWVLGMLWAISPWYGRRAGVRLD